MTENLNPNLHANLNSNLHSDLNKNSYKKTVAFLGPLGTYSHFAAKDLFEEHVLEHNPTQILTQASTQTPKQASVDYIALPSILDVFKKVQSGEVNVGVVPIENSIEGMVKDTINLFLDQSLLLSGVSSQNSSQNVLLNKEVIIIKEYTLDIDHSLLSKGLYMQDIKVVHAHPQALGQCKHWLDTHLPRVNTVSENSNTSAIKTLDTTGRDAIIASRKVAKEYELNVLAEHISDKQNNKTLFYVITQNTNNFFQKETLTQDIERHVRENMAKKIIFLLEADNKMGILRDLLSVFANHGAAVVRVQSLPTGEIGTYYFLVDVDISKSLEHIRAIYAGLSSQCVNVRVLGVV